MSIFFPPFGKLCRIAANLASRVMQWSKATASQCLRRHYRPGFDPRLCHSGLRYCIEVLEASLQTRVRSQAVSQPANVLHLTDRGVNTDKVSVPG